MIPGMSEAGSGIKAGSSVIKALKKASERPAWPNLYESLLDLHAVLDRWCAAANITSTAIMIEKRRRSDLRARGSEEMRRDSNTLGIGRTGDGKPSNLYSFPIGDNAGGSITFNYKNSMRDIGSMSPKESVVWRWSAQRNREAVRRSLRGLLAIYFPKLLTDFIDATDARADFASKNEDLNNLIKDATDDELNALDLEATRTRKQLVKVTNDLADVIVEYYPIKNPD